MNLGELLVAFRDALVSAGEAHNKLTEAYNAYVNELTAINRKLAEEKAKEVADE